MNIADVLDQLNLISTVQGWLWGLTSWLPYRRSRKGRKVGRPVIDGGTRTIRVDRRYTSGAEAEEILRRAHIPIAGRHVSSTDAYFVVRARQAAWAELVLLRAGVELAGSHQIINPKNLQYAAGKGAVPLWGRDRERETETLEPPARQAKSKRTPVKRVRKPKPRDWFDL